jgi:hypothetical protein
MYNTADYQENVGFSKPSIIYTRKKEKDIPKILGIIYSVFDHNGKEWIYNAHRNAFFKKPERGLPLYEWNWLRCNESDFEFAYEANPFPSMKIKVHIDYTLVFN